MPRKWKHPLGGPDWGNGVSATRSLGAPKMRNEIEMKPTEEDLAQRINECGLLPLVMVLIYEIGTDNFVIHDYYSVPGS